VPVILPIMFAAISYFALNLMTAKALGPTVPPQCFSPAPTT